MDGYFSQPHQRLRLLPVETILRKQQHNMQRKSEYDRYYAGLVPEHDELRVFWTHAGVLKYGSVLGAMLGEAGFVITDCNFHLPVPVAWLRLVDRIVEMAGDRPIMFYRPLVVRQEWINGCLTRNADVDVYDDLFRMVRDRFFVVSIADLHVGLEWMSSKPVDADLSFHHGELTFEMMAALAAQSSLVFCSPGFAAVLAQAVRTPLLCIFGGYENVSSFALGAQTSPTLGIEPINPCNCYRHDHDCDKRIHLPSARDRVVRFLASASVVAAAQRRAKGPSGRSVGTDDKVLEPRGTGGSNRVDAVGS